MKAASEQNEYEDILFDGLFSLIDGLLKLPKEQYVS